MKELTIEQKAKRYDEALKRAKITLDCCGSTSIITKNTIYDIFFELQESEDERMRKKLIAFLKTYDTLETSRYISWLEKQKYAWSEEDKRILDALIASLINERFAGRLKFLKGIKVSLVIDWLKSLKDKIKGE